MKQHIDLFDTSAYPKDERGLQSDTNKKKVGKFKDECDGKAPVSFVGLRSKMYSLLVGKDDEKKTAKGMKRSFVKHHVKHDMYLHTYSQRLVLKLSFEHFAHRNIL